MHSPEPNEAFEAHPETPAGEPSARLELERLADTSAADPRHSGAESGGTATWKGAASSVPKLRQKPAASPDLGAGDRFPGFTQDALESWSSATAGERTPRSLAEAAGAPAAATPLGATPPFWEIWLEHLTSLPRPILIGGVTVLLACGV